MSNTKPLDVYVLFAADAKYIKIAEDGCLAIFEDEASAKIAKRSSPGSDYKHVNYYSQKQVDQLQSERDELRARVESQHNQLLEIHRVTSHIAGVEVEPADYSETLTVRRVKEMAMLINQISELLLESRARVDDLEFLRVIPVIPCDPAWLLRKQAEAVERFANENRLWSSDRPSPYCLHENVIEDAQRLRQQADELEKPGGDHAVDLLLKSPIHKVI